MYYNIYYTTLHYTTLYNPVLFYSMPCNTVLRAAGTPQPLTSAQSFCLSLAALRSRWAWQQRLK